MGIKSRQIFNTDVLTVLTEMGECRRCNEKMMGPAEMSSSLFCEKVADQSSSL